MRSIPHPGQLRHMVKIGRTVTAANENGYPVETDETVCQVWAAVEDDSSRYVIAGDAETAARGLCFIIRWRGDVQPGMWVRFRGEKHGITKLGEYDFKRRYLKLTTASSNGLG
jgi:SPP1 family predicted phage head-tail adaptor